MGVLGRHSYNSSIMASKSSPLLVLGLGCSVPSNSPHDASQLLVPLLVLVEKQEGKAVKGTGGHSCFSAQGV